MKLAVECFDLTSSFPREEMYISVGQIRRAADSVPANIAEGWGRGSTGDYVRFLRVAQGSLKELETHLLLAAQKGLAGQEDVDALLAKCDELGRTLRGLYRSISRPSDG
jgi:four helix bundle protein